MQIPLVVALWEHTGYSGRRRLIVENTPDLGLQAFNDKVSAVGVHPGPDYAAWKTAHGGKEPTIGLYEHNNYGGAALFLQAGGYSNIHTLFNFGDTISSVKINPPPPSAHAISPIPLVVEIYQHNNYTGNRAVIVENVANIISYLGSDFNDMVTSIRVKEGPNYVAGNTAKFYRDVNYLGGHIELGPGNYPHIGTSHGFNDIISSIKLR